MIGNVIRGRINLGTVTTAQVLNGGKSNFFQVTLGAASIAFTFSDLKDGEVYILETIQDGTGSRALTISALLADMPPGAVNPKAGSQTTLYFVATSGTTALFLGSSNGATLGVQTLAKTGASPVFTAAPFALVNQCDGTVVTPTLPEITSANDGQSVIVAAGAAMTVTPFAGQTVDGAANYAEMTAAGKKAVFIADFANLKWLAFPGA